MVAHGVTLVGVCLAWELLGRGSSDAGLFVSRPSVIVGQLAEILSDPASAGHVGTTLYELGVGLGLGGVTGVLAAALVSRRAWLRRAVDPLVLSFYTIPRLALVPIFIAWFGLGMGSKIAVAFIHGFVLFLLGMYSAMDNVDRTMENNIRILGGRKRHLMRHVYLPFSAPFLFVAFRQSLGLGLGSVIITEMLSSVSGIGFELGLAVAYFDMSLALAWVIIAATLGVVLDQVAASLERRVVRWR